MSPSRSDRPDANDPLRPDDHADASTGSATGGSDVQSPSLGPVEWLRWGWRQLTSMRTALVLLLLLAIAAVPGSIVPQRSADPNGVTQYYADNPDLAPVLDNLQLFDVYTSAWFSAIYLLLFVSLIGCVIPRTKHHFKALKARPPRTPARLSRLDDYREVVVAKGDNDASAGSATDAEAASELEAAETAVQLASAQLKKAGYRVERYDAHGALSVSAERGYARETGNLVFHSALVGVLIAVGVGGGLTYTGQAVIIEGGTFVNSMLDYASFNPGRFVDPDALTPYSVTLDEFAVTYQPPGTPGAGQAGDFEAHVTSQLAGGDAQDGVVRVNHPVDVAGDRIYLMGNGYAPEVTIRNADGDVVYRESVPFLPQDANMTSLGVVKVPDGLPEQLGLVGFFYPTAQELTTGALTSVYPDLVYPVLTLDVYAGDLGIDDGTPRSVYTLDPTGMEKLAGRGTDVEAIRLMPGQYAELPDGLGTITFDDISSAAAPVEAGSDVSHSTDYSDSVARFVSLSVHRDVAAPWVLAFALLALGGLMAALFVPRRRMWVKVTPEAGALRIEYAGLARGEDPALASALDQVVRAHGAALGGALTESAGAASRS